jgi:hypothetical protein
MTEDVTSGKTVHLVGHNDEEAYATLQLAATALCAANQLKLLVDRPPPGAEYLKAGKDILIEAIALWLAAQPDPEGSHAAMFEVGHQLFGWNEEFAKLRVILEDEE